ncbi:hypothetical protein EYC98_19235 [Halieaceae bacterium IMCC14734]|uniref:Aspartyl/asparaginy/proline hydroxylase domain-containing protein n=1 Tax=Candidatus Litorirhabdus singularis TaxID=2518993 RepID=A0ABT3TKZ7_9GAMM|nr:aspartyl/asparaginyl beta-hydroxylase domain-containing protein [Candidatus Litorirhabdus singularis]MCX2983002.1 hypothetical protein [Candidatus Litorirhabdus singularis]
MDIAEPLIDLGEYQTSALSEVILTLPAEAWGDPFRQQTYDVHHNTESVMMVFTDGSGWPDIEVRKEAGWDLLAATAVPLMHQIIADHYPVGGTIVRAVAAKLVAGGVIKSHRDTHPSFHFGHRIHVPISTNPRVRFNLDGRPYRFALGRAYEINNQLQHSVSNKGDCDRITFIFDYVPPAKLQEMAKLAQTPISSTRE